MKFRHLLAIAGVLTGVCAQHSVAQTPRPPVAVAVSPQGSSSFLGVGVKEVDSDRAKELKLKEEAGVEVMHVDENSPAEKAGIKAGDVIIDYNNQRIEGIEQFSRLVRETPAGRDVKLQVFRNGAPQTIVAKIGSRRGMATPQFDMGNNY